MFDMAILSSFQSLAPTHVFLKLALLILTPIIIFLTAYFLVVPNVLKVRRWSYYDVTFQTADRMSRTHAGATSHPAREAFPL